MRTTLSRSRFLAIRATLFNLLESRMGNLLTVLAWKMYLQLVQLTPLFVRVVGEVLQLQFAIICVMIQLSAIAYGSQKVRKGRRSAYVIVVWLTIQKLLTQIVISLLRISN